MASGLYRGYSSYEYQDNKTFKLTDVELVKLDLLNHMFTRKGERVMMPRFGTRIPDLAFEPMDDITLMVLEEDLRAVVNFDPRVKLLDLRIIPSPDENQVTASVDLLYIELDTVDTLDLNITFEAG
jgi:phage baseplate assembly protein W